ncbi:MFS transporter [Rhodovibrio salinarum]|uniref:MFS transporter n=1 Tax=Rhodovibrio salinarum TaxID=1087 RepID=A0A934QIH9_9PROT|nr:MFS transporter [Rhodovibrio salinarum]MBK1697065.1 MFS transporter [Rhodovibrio salinarum]
MIRHPALAMGLLGSGLIAVTYGLARFAFGLFLPSMREDMAIAPELAGVIGAIPFASFVIAILLGPPLVRQVGAKLGGVTAITLATLGLGAIATAPDPWMLALGVAVCGVATGLSTPAMAAAVHRVVPKMQRGRVNAAVNAGTSIGVALAAPAVVLFADAWRPAYFGFAGVAALGVLAAALFLPAHAKPAQGAADTPGPTRRQWADMTRLSSLAAATGFVSALYWVFAPDFAVQAGGLAARDSAWMWLAVGIGGLAGGAAGDLIAKHGPASSHAFVTAVMAASLTLLAADPGQLALALFSAAAFGAAYMTLTGIYLVGGTEIMPDHPALGSVMPFLAVAAGQVLGSSASGWMIAQAGHGTAFGSFAALGLGVSLVSLWLTRTGQAATEEG